MGRNVNKIQSDILLNRMKENPEMAGSYVREDKEKRKKFWKQLTFELNSAGPPEKNESEWKKVWIDQRRYMQRKASGYTRLEGFDATQCTSPADEIIEEFSEHMLMNSHSGGQNQMWLKRLNRSLDRICRQKQMQLAEMKRHNLQMEKLKQERIEQELIIKRRLLQLKEEKLNLMRQNMN